MATTKSKATLYFEPDIWQQFREACLRRRVSASRIIGDFLTQQLMQWKEETVPLPPQRPLRRDPVSG